MRSKDRHTRPQTALRREQVEKMIIFGRQIQRRPMTRQAGYDPPMLPGQAGRMKGACKLLPSRGGIGYDSDLFFFGQLMHRGRQGSKRFLHAFIRRREFEPGIKRIEVSAKLVFEHMDRIGLGWVGFRHGHFWNHTVGTGTITTLQWRLI